MITLTFRLKGGAGSGNFGHSGRPGKVGGSSGGGMPGVSDEKAQQIATATTLPYAKPHNRGNDVKVDGQWRTVEKLDMNTVRVETYLHPLPGQENVKIRPKAEIQVEIHSRPGSPKWRFTDTSTWEKWFKLAG